MAACVAWLAVAGYGVRDALFESGDDWELAYTLYAVALAFGAALTWAVLMDLSRSTSRRPLRAVGLAVTALGCFFAFVGAWALPLWMVLLGLGFGVVGLAVDGPARRSAVFLAATQFAGVAVQFAALGLGADEDVAAGVALIVTSVAMAAGLGTGSVAADAVVPAVPPAPAGR